MTRLRTAALVGNPNSGKSALLQRAYRRAAEDRQLPGVTVERKAGGWSCPQGEPVELVDLPGSYALDAASPDEEVTRKVVLGEFAGEAQP
jgi:ferrous iron transport protein B